MSEHNDGDSYSKQYVSYPARQHQNSIKQGAGGAKRNINSREMTSADQSFD